MGSQDIITDGLVLHLDASRATESGAPGTNSPEVSTWYDRSLRGNDGTLTNFGLTSASGWDGDGSSADPYKCVLDGSNDRVDCGDLSIGEDKTFTYEVWASISDTSATIRSLFSEGNSAQSSRSYTWLYLSTDGYLGFYAKDDANVAIVSAVGSTDVRDGDVHHLAATVDGSNAQLYLDGEAHGSPVALAGSTLSTDLSTVGMLGRSSYSLPFPGAILVARVYNDALSTDEVASNYAAGYTWTTSPSYSVSYEPAYSLRVGAGIAKSLTLYPANDGHVVSYDDDTYADARAGTGVTKFADDDLDYFIVGQNMPGNGSYYLFEGFIEFDTSQIPASASVTGATLSINPRTDWCATEYEMDVRYCDFDTAITVADYIAGDDLGNYITAGAVDTSGFVVGTYSDITLTNLGAIQTGPGATTGFALDHEDRDDDSAPLAIDDWGIYGIGSGQSLAPKLTVTYQTATAPEELAPTIDPDSLTHGSTERGFGSFEVTIPVTNMNESVSSALERDQTLELYDHDELAWEGKCTSASVTGHPDPVCRITGAGLVESCKRDEGYAKTFTDAMPYDRIMDLPVEVYGDDSVLDTWADSITIDRDGQLLVNMPNDTDYASGQGVVVGYWLNGGMNPDQTISRVVFDYTWVPGTNMNAKVYTVSDVYESDQEPITTLVTGAAGTDAWGKVDSDVSADNARGIVVAFYASGTSQTTADRYLQIRNMTVYSGTQAARTIDEAVVEIAVTDSAVASSSSVTTVGSALNHLLVEPHTTRADALTQIAARHSSPVAVGFWDDATVHCLPRPTTPPDRTRHYQLSGGVDSFDWDVEVDDEAGVDYVKVLYDLEVDNLVSDPSPSGATWPDSWYRNDESAATAVSSKFRFRSTAADEANPYGEYRDPDSTDGYIAVVPGQRYIGRVRIENDSYNDGNHYVIAYWYQSDGQASAVDAWDSLHNISSAVTTEQWKENQMDCPSDAVFARIRAGWTGATGDGTNRDFLVRDVTFRTVTPDATPLYVYRPGVPSTASARVGLLDIGGATTTEARNAGDQYLDYYQNPVAGSITVRGSVRDIDGREWPLSHIHAWDWIQCSDIIGSTLRGPHYITSVEHSADTARITIGGDDSYAYAGPTRITNKPKYIGGKRVWKRKNGKKVRRFRSGYYKGLTTPTWRRV